MQKSAKGDWGLKILSVLLAVVLWVYVSNELNPTKNREFKAIPVETRGVGQNLAVSELPGSVSVRVQGNQNVIAELDVRAIEVFVDLSKVSPGKVMVPVQVRVPSGIKVMDLRPQQVSVKLEQMAEKQVPVNARYTDASEKNYKVLTVRTKPDEVIVRGPASVIDTVNYVAVDIKLKNRFQSFGETLPVKVKDETGNSLEERLVKRTPEVVDVFVSIVPDLPAKKVRLVPRVIGEPANGYEVTNIEIEPQEITITGEQDLINTIDRVLTSAVNIEGVREDMFIETAPELPQGVTADRQSLRVLVKIGQE